MTRKKMNMKILLLHYSAAIAVAASAEATEVERQNKERGLASTGYGFETPDAAFETMEAALVKDKTDSGSGTGPGTFRFPSAAPISLEDYEEEIRAEINEEDSGPISFQEYEETLIMEIKEKESNTTKLTIDDSNATISPTQEDSQDPSEGSDILEDWTEDFISETPSDTIASSDTPSDVPSDMPSMVPTDRPSNGETFVPNTNRVPHTLPPAAQVHFSSQYYYTRGPTTKLPLATFSPTMHPVTTMNAAINTNAPTSQPPHSLPPEVQFSGNQWTPFNPPTNTNKPTASSLAPTFRPSAYPTSQPSKRVTATERPTVFKAEEKSEVFKFPTTIRPIAPTETPTTPEVFSFPSLPPNDQASTTTAGPTQADSEESSEEDILEDWIARFITDLPTDNPSSSGTEDDDEAVKEARTKTTTMPTTTVAPTAPTIAPSPVAPSTMPSIPTLMFLESRLLPQPEDESSSETEGAVPVEESTESLSTTRIPDEKNERTTIDIFCDFTFSLFCTPKHRR